MIRIIERYIAKKILAATSLSALVMAAILFLMSLLGELKNIGEGDYGLYQAFLYVIAHLPNDLYQFLPMLTLLGSMLALSILSMHLELAVLRASGFSVFHIIITVLMSVFLLLSAAFFIGEWLAPHLSYIAEIHKENVKNKGQAVITGTGVWFHVENNFIHVEEVVGRQLLKGVTRYQFDDLNRLQTAYYANTLAFEKEKWIMHDVVKTDFYPERTKSKAMAEMPLNLTFNSNLLNIGLIDATNMPLPKLSKYIQYLKQNGLQAGEFEFNFWRRVFEPFASIVMVLLGIPFVVTFRASLGRRILTGMVLGFVFFILNALLGQLSIVYQLSPMWAALLPILIFSFISLFILRKLIRN